MGRGRGAGGSVHVPPGSELSSFSQAVRFDVPFSSPSCGCWRKNESAVQGHELCLKTAMLALPGFLAEHLTAPALFSSIEGWEGRLAVETRSSLGTGSRPSWRGSKTFNYVGQVGLKCIS